MPSPVGLVVTKGWKIFPCTAAGMPNPLSRTRISTPSPRRLVPTLTVGVRTRQLDGAVEIRVTDNGTGMSPAVQAKIFQPFFTTKPTGEGTGLGLSLSYDIIAKAHGGTLTVESQEGEGTEFLISLPL